MKKTFTLLFASLLAFVGAVKAQVKITDVAQLTDDMECTIGTAARGGWAVNEAGDNFGSTNDHGFGLTVSAVNDQHIFQFKTIDGNVYLYSVYAEKYVNKDRSLSATATDAISFIAQQDGTFVVKFDDTHYINIGGENQITIDNWGAGTYYGEAEYDAGNKVTITDVTDLRHNAIIVTYVYKLGDKEYKRIEVTQTKNSDAVAPTEEFLVVVSYEGSIGEENCEVVVNCSENLPFAVTEDINSPIWQIVEMHRYGTTFRVWEYDKIDAAVAVVDYNSKKIDAVADNKLWCFTGNLIDGFNIYNKAATTSYTLNATAGKVSVGTAVDGNNVWKLAESSVSAESIACFTNDGTNYANHQNNELAYWGDNDNGSTCYFLSPAEIALSEAVAIKNQPQDAIGSYVISEENQSALDVAVDVLEKNTDDLNACNDLIAAIKAIQGGDKVEYTDGYYRIYNAQPVLYANSKGLIYDSSAEKPFRWGTVEEGAENAIFKLTTDDEKIVLQSVVDNKYMQGVGGAAGDAMSESGHFTLTELGNAQYNLVFGNGTMHAEGHNGGKGTSGALVDYPEQGNSPSAWYLVKTSYIPTGIEQLTAPTSTVIYDLTGRRVEKMQKGIYIVNGKKVLVK